MRMLARRIVAVTALAVATGCSSEDTRAVVARVRSPDGRVDAVVTRDPGCGATCPWTFGVYLVERGRELPPDADWAQFRATSAESLAVRWRDRHTLLVAYHRANIYGFRNRWYLDAERSLKEGRPLEVIEVRLAPTDSVSLPPGE